MEDENQRLDERNDGMNSEGDTRRSERIAEASPPTASAIREDNALPRAKQKETQSSAKRRLPLIVPLVSCLALGLSSWEFLRESRNSAGERRAETIRSIRDNMMTLVDLETEQRQAMESTSQAGLSLSSALNATMQILVQATSEDVDKLIDHLNPSILISFAYYSAYAGNYHAAERYYLEVLRRLEEEPSSGNLAIRQAVSVGLGNLYLGPSTLADRARGRRLFEDTVAEYESEADMANQGSLIEVLSHWAYMESIGGDRETAEELRRRARAAVLVLAPEDPRRISYERALSGGSVYFANDFMRVNGEWRVEFPEDVSLQGTATIRSLATPTGREWYIHSELYNDSIMTQQWTGNGFATENESVIFPIQGYKREKEFLPLNGVFGTVQIRVAFDDEDMLQGTVNLLGVDSKRIRLRRKY